MVLTLFEIVFQLDILGQLALRILLYTASGIDEQSSKSPHGLASPNCFSLIADHLHGRANAASNNASVKRRSHRKTTKQAPTSCMDGFDHLTGSYGRDYWAVFCLRTHEESASRVVLSKCALFATYLAKILHQVLTILKQKPRKQPSGEYPPNSTKETACNVEIVLKRLSLKNCFGDSDDSMIASIDMEEFRKKTLELCENAAADAPAAKLKPQSCFFSKGDLFIIRLQFTSQGNFIVTHTYMQYIAGVGNLRPSKPKSAVSA